MQQRKSCQHVYTQPVSKTETPKERLKRLMAAQINKQVAKDSVKSAQRIAHEEKERKARIHIERMHYDGGRRSPSPDRYRSVLSFAASLGMMSKLGSRLSTDCRNHAVLAVLMPDVSTLNKLLHVLQR